jgi:hypothetical protein
VIGIVILRGSWSFDGASEWIVGVQVGLSFAPDCINQSMSLETNVTTAAASTPTHTTNIALQVQYELNPPKNDKTICNQ